MRPDIVHFAGHAASGEGLIFDSGRQGASPVGTEVLASLFSIVNRNADAVRAHESGRGYVRLHGVLHRGQRSGRIDPLRALQFLDEQAANLSTTPPEPRADAHDNLTVTPRPTSEAPPS